MAASQLWKFPLDLDSNTLEYPHRITFQALKSRNNSTSPAPGSMVALYLPPEALKAAYTQSYGDVDMGSLGIALAGVGREGAQNVVGAALGGDMAGTLSALKGLKGTSGNIGQSLIAATAKEAIGKMGGPAGTAITALQRKVGVIMNPHKAIIYQGPGGFRTFSYTFTMSPENLDEAEAVKNIVRFFKFHMHPGVAGISDPDPQAVRSGTAQTRITAGGNINTSAALTYPEEFEIKMLLNSASTTTANSPLFKIGKCVMDNFSVDYATSGGAAFFADGGEPVTTTISLGFKETILMTKQTIAKGF
jgi:hypothetical protein